MRHCILCWVDIPELEERVLLDEDYWRDRLCAVHRAERRHNRWWWLAIAAFNIIVWVAIVLLALWALQWL